MQKLSAQILIFLSPKYPFILALALVGCFSQELTTEGEGEGRNLSPVLEVGAATLRAGQQGAAHCPAVGADDVGGLTAVERRLGWSEATHHAH